MKSKLIVVLLLASVFLFVSCSGDLTNDKAKAIFEKQFPGKIVKAIVLKKLGKDSYVARINTGEWSILGTESTYLFSKFNDGWKCEYSSMDDYFQEKKSE